MRGYSRGGWFTLELSVVKIDVPKDVNVIVGMARLEIKTLGCKGTRHRAKSE